MANQTKHKPTIAEIERLITAEEHILVRLFLSLRVQAISLIAGVLLVVVSKLNALGVLDVFTVTRGSLIGLFGVLIAIYGAIGLANRDWQWGKERKQ